MKLVKARLVIMLLSLFFFFDIKGCFAESIVEECVDNVEEWTDDEWIDGECIDEEIGDENALIVDTDNSNQEISRKVKIPVRFILDIKDGFMVDTKEKNDEITLSLISLTDGRETDDQKMTIRTEELDDVENQMSGSFEFAEMEFETSGIYEYEISETVGSHQGYIYDETIYHVIVSVGENESAVTYFKTYGDYSEKVDSVVFTNSYAPDPIYAKNLLPVVNTLQVKRGFAINDNNSTVFEIMMKDSSDQVTSFSIHTDQLKLSASDASYDVYSGEMMITSPAYTTPATYQYCISEDNGKQNGYCYDASEFLLEVNVVDNNGVLEIKNTNCRRKNESGAYETVQGVEFLNSYKPAAIQYDFIIENNIDGSFGQDYQYEFWLTRGSLSGISEAGLVDIEANRDGRYSRYQLKKLVITGGGCGSLSLSFGTPGTYTYYASERGCAEQNSIQCDKTEYRIVVKVNDSGGILTKSITCTKENTICEKIVFTNRCIHRQCTNVFTKATTAKDGVNSKKCNCCGVITKSTVIPKVSNITISAPSRSYTGKAIKPVPTVKDSKGKTLVKDVDYSLTYGTNTAIGKGTVVIAFCGKQYAGKKTLSFSIIPKTVAGIKAVSAGTGKMKVSWTRSVGGAGYKVYRADSKSGTYKLIKTITDNSVTTYINSGLTTGKMYYYKIKGAKKIGSTTYSSENYSSIASGKSIPATVVFSVPTNPSSKIISLKWTPVAGASGYEVWRSLSKEDGYYKVKTLYGTNINTFRDGGVVFGKKYDYKIRAFKRVNIKNVYGKFSSVKSCKVTR